MNAYKVEKIDSSQGIHSWLIFLLMTLFFNISYGQVQETEVVPTSKAPKSKVTISPTTSPVKIKPAVSGEAVKVTPAESGAVVVPTHQQTIPVRQPITTRRKSTSLAIPASIAESLVEAEKSALGFEQVYFEAKELDRLMAYPGVTGIRFYTAQTSASNASQTVIAVAVDKQGEDVGKYLYAKDNKSKKLREKDAAAWVQRSKESRFSAISCVFSKKEIQNLMTSKDASGIHIKPGVHERNKTFVLSAAKIDVEGTIDSRSEYLLGMAPCPNVCGGVVLGQNEDN